MKRLAQFAAQCCLLLSVPAAVPAQEVFVTRGAGSPMYSDQPQAGAKPVLLPELNISKPVPVPKVAAPAASRVSRESDQPAAAVPAYHRFSIVEPANDGSVAANNALFEVRVAMEPTLQLGNGHAITVSINGRPVGQRFTTNEFMIPPEFWGDTLPPTNQRYQLDAAIVDGHGNVLKQSVPVTFYLRHLAGWYPRRPPRPMLLPMPVQKPPLPPPTFGKFEQPGKPPLNVKPPVRSEP